MLLLDKNLTTDCTDFTDALKDFPFALAAGECRICCRICEWTEGAGRGIMRAWREVNHEHSNPPRFDTAD